MDLVQWWKRMKDQLPTLAGVALHPLPILHPGGDVDRPFSYYRLSRKSLQGLGCALSGTQQHSAQGVNIPD